MPRVRIFGFPPRDTILCNVSIFYLSEFGNSSTQTLFSGHQNIQGEIDIEINTNESDIAVVVIPESEFLNYQKFSLKANTLGYYHTIRFSFNHNRTQLSSLPFNPDEIFEASQRKMNRELRDARHRNPIIKTIVVLLSILSIVGSFFYSLYLGVLISIVVTIILYFLNRFSSGYEKAF